MGHIDITIKGAGDGQMSEVLCTHRMMSRSWYFMMSPCKCIAYQVDNFNHVSSAQEYEERATGWGLGVGQIIQVLGM